MIRTAEGTSATARLTSLEDLLEATQYWPDDERRRLLAALRVLEKQWNAKEWKISNVLDSIETVACLFHRNRSPRSPGEVVTALCALLNDDFLLTPPACAAGTIIERAVSTLRQRMNGVSVITPAPQPPHSTPRVPR